MRVTKWARDTCRNLKLMEMVKHSKFSLKQRLVVPVVCG